MANHRWKPTSLKIKARHHSKSFPIDQEQLETQLNQWLNQHQLDSEFIPQWRQQTANYGDLKTQAKLWLSDQKRMQLYLEDKVQTYLSSQANSYKELYTEKESAQFSAQEQENLAQAWIILKRKEAVKLYKEQLRERERGEIQF